MTPTLTLALILTLPVNPGHEGEGSLLSYVKRKSLANGLGSGYSSPQVWDFALFEVRTSA